MQEDKQTHFGYKTIAVTEKTRLVRHVFDGVASHYDLMNDVMSGGIHRLWKSSFLTKLAPHPKMTLLDVGGGTGDIALGFRKRGGGNAIVCDINYNMLQIGRDRAVNHNELTRIAWVCGNAEQLPFADMSMDAYSIAFCLRNVTDIKQALSEAYRVLRPGGRFLCLEFSTVIVPLLKPLYDRYSFDIVPRLGNLIAGNRDAYQYLVESIRCFPKQEELKQIMAMAGFENISITNLSGGIAAIHMAWRL